MPAETAAKDLLEAIIVRDADAVAAAFSPNARMRALLPGGAEEIVGGAAIAARLDAWFGGADPFEVLSKNVHAVAEKISIGYRLRLKRPGADIETVIEQTIMCATTNGRIETADLLCSGFLPVPSMDGRTHSYEAGSLGCADGLTTTFRDRIKEVDVGDLLRVHTVDPSAKEDLPAMARLMGHTVRSVEAHPDGGLMITVERGR